MKLTRRQIAPALVGLTVKGSSRIAGGFVNESVERGHRLRDGTNFATPAETKRIPIVVIGGGIAGLSAAWWMDRNGFRDFIVLELEPQAGGNSRSGQNEVSTYPWAAHYVPVPDKQATLVHELFAELGVLNNGEWDERWLCHSPQERLFIHGRWQEGVEPHTGLTGDDFRQFDRFLQRMKELHATGRFTVPMQRGFDKSTGAERAFDNVTMGDWMRRQGFTSKPLHWLVDYSTRDDYGTHADNISAWAGIHYFASREPEDKGPLTWPAGNGWIVKKLLAKLGKYVQNSSMAFRVGRSGTRWVVRTERVTYECDCVIWAAPTWLASWVVNPAPQRWPVEYAPWLVSNLTLDGWPMEKGHPPAWDNVIYNSPSLGYVVATHQNLTTHQPRTVWTHYWALADGSPAEQRRVLLNNDWGYWSEKVLMDLERAHPDIRRFVSRIDVFRIGHAMPRPTPGVIFSPERVARLKPRGGFAYANSDLSALSLFEEAQWRGVEAARYALSRVGSSRNASSTGTR